VRPKERLSSPCDPAEGRPHLPSQVGGVRVPGDSGLSGADSGVPVRRDGSTFSGKRTCLNRYDLPAVPPIPKHLPCAGNRRPSFLASQQFVISRELLNSIGQYRPMSDTGASGNAPTDAAVITQSVVDPGFFSLIVERHATSVFRYLASRVDRSKSEDLLADVFEAAFKARTRYDTHYENALPWLLGIATNVIRHHRRSEIRHASMVRRVTQLHRRSNETSEAIDAVATTAQLDDEMQCVRRALAGLNDRHRQVLVLSAGLGLSYEDIAQTLGIRIGTVRSRLSRARRRLRELLEADGQYVGKDELD
jgi:RNA polymerase sigma factor (sigma-70 family)